jgi:hypothetical protein
VNFLVDMPLPPALAHWLVTQGHDAVHAKEVGLAEAPDTAIMATAAREQRTVVTADLDFPRLLALTAAVEPSLVLFRSGDWNEAQVVARMADVLAVLGPAGIDSALFVVDRERIRRRALPIG